MAGTITAAAQKWVASTFTRQARPANQSWQDIAWGYWEDTPEVRFAGAWVGNTMSRCRLIAGRRAPDGTVEVIDDPNHPAHQIVAQIGGGVAGQAQMLREFGPHLVVAGEAWVVVHQERWFLVSTKEANVQGKRLTVTLDGKAVEVPLVDDEAPDHVASPDDTLAIRVYEPHPAKHMEADSPIRSSFALLDELRLLNAAVAAIAKSRLSGRGLVFVPQGTKFPTAPGDDGAADDFVETLLQVAQTAYQNPDSAAAAVPIILEIPMGEGNATPERMTFESEFDTLAVTLREETIRRFATTIDTPAEVLLGSGGINHWSLWATDESALRLAVEPKLVTICSAFTDYLLHPALIEDGTIPADEVEDYLVWFDSTGARVRTNRSETAFQMYDRNEINGDALRRTTDFGDDDAPNEAERREGLLVRLVTAAPSLWPEIGPLLGFAATTPAEVIEEGVDPVVVEDVELPVDEDPAPPDTFDDEPTDEVVGAALLAACDGMVYRAIERAGQRLRSRQPRSQRGVLQTLNAVDVHTAVVVNDDDDGVLDGAWDRLDVVATRLGVDPARLGPVLDGFVRRVLTAGIAYDIDDLASTLSAVRLTHDDLVTVGGD